MTLILADKEISEARVETRLKRGLEGHGFKVLKLTTPGTSFTPDRLILRPLWSPGAPYAVELKRPKKREQRAQEIVRDDWRARGVQVLGMVNTYELVDQLIATLVDIAERERPPLTPQQLYELL